MRGAEFARQCARCTNTDCLPVSLWCVCCVSVPAIDCLSDEIRLFKPVFSPCPCVYSRNGACSLKHDEASWFPFACCLKQTLKVLLSFFCRCAWRVYSVKKMEVALRVMENGATPELLPRLPCLTETDTSRYNARRDSFSPLFSSDSVSHLLSLPISPKRPSQSETLSLNPRSLASQPGTSEPDRRLGEKNNKIHFPLLPSFCLPRMELGRLVKLNRRGS